MQNSKLSTEEVRHIGKLANLKLSKGEVEKFRKQLSAILDYVEKLREVETKEVGMTSQTTGLVNVFREDEVNKGRYTSKGDFYKIKAIYRG